jgi:hypothetical protein
MSKKGDCINASAYTENGRRISKKEHIIEELLKGFGFDIIQLRVSRFLEEQSEHTKTKTKAFTSSWICSKINNQCDLEWFGRENVFNIENGQKL